LNQTIARIYSQKNKNMPTLSDSKSSSATATPKKSLKSAPKSSQKSTPKSAKKQQTDELKGLTITKKPSQSKSQSAKTPIVSYKSNQVALKKEKQKVSQSFFAFLALIVVSGFLVGGLFASFGMYRNLSSEQKTQKTDQSITLPSTGGTVEESTINSPLPSSTEPGITNTQDGQSPAGSQSQTPTTSELKQPAGTTEFNNGKYKVYQYPDGNIVVVW
jgi:hypothetical protein